MSVGPLGATSDSKSFSMLIAVAVFDHCSVEFFELTRNRGDKLVMTALTERKLQNIHKIPVKQIRLSKKNPNLLVSCGDESDLYLKLWNVAKKSSEPINQV